MFSHAPSPFLVSGASPLGHLVPLTVPFIWTAVILKFNHLPCAFTSVAVQVCQLRVNVWHKIVSLNLLNCLPPGVHSGGTLFQGQVHQFMVIPVTRDHDTHHGLPYFCISAFLCCGGTIIFRLQTGKQNLALASRSPLDYLRPDNPFPWSHDGTALWHQRCRAHPG